MSITPAVPARRGDLVVFVSAPDREENVRVELGTAVSVSRAGLVLAWDSPFLSGDGPRRAALRPTSGAQVMVVSAGVLDVRAAMDAYRKHTWEGHTQIKPFGSVKEARGFLREHRLSVTV